MDEASGDQIEIGDVSQASGVAVGRESQALSASEVSGTIIQSQDSVQATIINAQGAIIGAAVKETRRLKRQAPPPPPHYVERGEVEERVREVLKLRQGEAAIVNLYGQPGVGKTSLACKLAADLEAEFEYILYADAEAQAPNDILWGFIKTFDPQVDRSSLHEGGQYLTTLAQVLGEKRVLFVLNRVSSPSQARALLPSSPLNLVALIISTTRLLEQVQEKRSVYLPEMTPEQAEALFRNLWNEAYRSTPDIVLHDLAQELNYMPETIALVARDILSRQVAPVDFLEEIRSRKQKGDFSASLNAPGLQAVHENLPGHGRQALPYLAVMGAGAWSFEALIAASQLPRRRVEVGLRQLMAAGFAQLQADGRYRSSPVVREFALLRLKEQGGEALVNASRKVMTYYMLDQAREMLSRHQQELLDEYLMDKNRARLFNEKLVESMEYSSFGEEDVLQSVFEQVVLSDLNFSSRWYELGNHEVFADVQSGLLEALDWAIQLEDWELVRRFAFSTGLGRFSFNTKGTPKSPRYENGIYGGFISGYVSWAVEHIALLMSLKAARVIKASMEDCSLITSGWLGVHLSRCSFEDVDLVAAIMPGLVARRCSFDQVDLRSADLRGAQFDRCSFSDVNLRAANLSGTEFIKCSLDKVDFRNARLDGMRMTEVSIRDARFDDIGWEER